MDGQNVALTIWEAKTKDNFGNITQYNLGNGLQTNKVFDQYTGMLNQIKTGTSSSQTSIQNLQYQYDDLYNITQRKDVLSNQQDVFTYDNLNRLTEIQTFPNASQTTYTSKVMAFDDFGNITNKTGVGDMTYGVANDPNNPDPPVFASPYQINKIVNNPNTITTPQNILYTSFNKVRKITTTDEDGNNAKELYFVYGPDYGRRKTTYKLNGNVTSTKYYAFGNYEEEVNTVTGIKKDYYIYGGDGVAAIYRISGVGTNTTSTMYYIHKDNLGSFDKVTDQSGTVVDSYSFDAWGNRRSVTNWTAAETGVTHLFNRGFTGHEHLDAFGLINMNGRCYDPLLGRILSPDPDLQDPSNIQNYNRYSYCLNNPLKYTDPSGYKHSTDDLSKFFDRRWGVWGCTGWDSENNSHYLWGDGGFMDDFGGDFGSPEEDACGGGGGGGGNGGFDSDMAMLAGGLIPLSCEDDNNVADPANDCGKPGDGIDPKNTNKENNITQTTTPEISIIPFLLYYDVTTTITTYPNNQTGPIFTGEIGKGVQIGYSYDASPFGSFQIYNNSVKASLGGISSEQSYTTMSYGIDIKGDATKTTTYSFKINTLSVVILAIAVPYVIGFSFTFAIP